MSPIPAAIDPRRAAGLLTEWGFLADPDLPERVGQAHLLVALRDRPTLRHYDPEIVEYWVSRQGRGRARTLTRDTPMPLESDFSWGMIKIVDRLGVSNEYLTFGGHLSAAAVGDVIVAVFASPAPILRRGGHSQTWDHGAQSLGGFFGRLLVAVDYAPGFEELVAAAQPLTRYAAFVADTVAHYRSSPALRSAHERLWTLLTLEEGRLRHNEPGVWAAGEELLASAAPAG